MNTKGILLSVSILLLSHLAFAQEPILEWAMGFGQTEYANLEHLVDEDGNIFVWGSFYNTVDLDPGPGVLSFTSGGTNNAFFMKLNPEGELEWAKQISSTNSSSISFLRLDPSGNLYFSGFYTGTADFDPGAGTFDLTSVTSFSNDAFVAKYDPTGNLIWAKSVGGTGSDRANAVALDNSGNVFLGGNFQSSADMDPGAGVTTVVSASDDDPFILKLDNTGAFQWARSFGGASFFDIMNGVEVDDTGNVYLSGYFWDSLDVDPGPGVSMVYSEFGPVSGFIIKLDPSGNLKWGKRYGNWGIIYTSGSFIHDNELYIYGEFNSGSDFDPGAGTFYVAEEGYYDVFVSKYDLDGNFISVLTIGGTGYENTSSVDIDPDGNVYVGGVYEDTVDFDRGAGVFEQISTQDRDAFLAKYNASFDFEWVMTTPTNEWEPYWKVAYDPNGSLVTLLLTEDTTDMDPGPVSLLNYSDTSGSDLDGIIARFKPEAAYLGGNIHYRPLGGLNWEMAATLMADSTTGIPANGLYLDHTETGGSFADSILLTKREAIGIGNGLLQTTYKDTISFDVNGITAGNDHIFELTKCCRSPLSNATSNAQFYNRSTLRALGTSESYHTSKQVAFLAPPVVEQGKPVNFHLNLFDQDLDSVDWSAGSISALLSPSGTDPAWTLPSGMSFETADKNLTWSPTDTGNFAFRMQIDEYNDSSGNFLGSSAVEMQMRVVNIPGSNTSPIYPDTASWPTNADGRFQFTAPVGVNFTLLVETTDPDGDALSSVSSGGENNNTTTNTATFAPVIVDTNTMQGTYEWLPDSLDHRDAPYEVTFRATEEKDAYSLYADVSILIKTQLGVGREDDLLSEEPRIRLYPNPASEMIFIEMMLTEPQSLSISLSDLNGNHVDALKTSQIKAGKAVLMQQLPALSEGIYLLKIKGSAGFEKTSRLMIH